MYQITDYTIQRAKEYGVKVNPSTNSKKKIDVFKNGEKIASIGAMGYKDYPTYIQERGKSYADERRRLYHIRHRRNIDKIGSPGFWAGVLLW
jgi:hypothetical protein